MQFTKIDVFIAKGIERNGSLFLLQDEAIKTGDYLLIQDGYGIQKISKA